MANAFQIKTLRKDVYFSYYDLQENFDTFDT